jgi:WD40 repeat protein
VYSPKLHGETLQGHEPVGRLAFSPDGNLLALGSAWGSIQLFDTNTYSPLGEPLKGHQGEITGLAFPNDTTLISASDDGRVWQWDIDPESWARKLCSIANRNLSQDEWNKYMKDKPYQPTCRDLPSGEGAPAN